MGEFQFSKNKQGETLTVQIKGHIDEDAILSNIDYEGASQVNLDLQDVTAINSCGIREWIKWVKSAPNGCKIVYKNCPKIIVDQINMVAGFLPDNGVVESFYVPYYNEDSGNEKMILFKSGAEFKGGEIFPPAAVKDESGQEMEMDVIEAKYFKFLKK